MGRLETSKVVTRFLLVGLLRIRTSDSEMHDFHSTVPPFEFITK